jgi:DNA recombination protein RmuC
MDLNTLFVATGALLIGGLVGWLWGGQSAGALGAARDALAADRDEQVARFKAAVVDLASESQRREAAELRLATLQAQHSAREAALGEQIDQLKSAQTALTAQFREVGQAMLDQAQKAFLDRADARFKESEATAGQNLKALLTPVHDRLARYEEGVAKVEAERREAYGNIEGLIGAMRMGQEEVKAVTASLNNALRNAPKARGRWGEQQLRNVLESCGLTEHVDFATEVSLDTDDGRLRPDAIINVPGGQKLVVDAKVSLNAYQDAGGASDEGERARHLLAHAAAMKAHVTTLGAKAYQDQFDEAPDYVIMFVPGEHFLAAALETDPGLWEYGFNRRVLLATPTNLVAIARTVAGVWRQEKVAGQAREIAALGKELYARMATMAAHIVRLGKNLDQASGAYNAFIGSFESQVLSQARRFEALDVDTSGKDLADLPAAEVVVRPLTKLAVGDRVRLPEGDA